jgi:S-adenosylhomocysteine hydrolase
MKVQKFKLLDYLNSIFENIDLDGCHIICVQHIVASTISLFNSLFENGLSPKNLSAIGKCYSTRPEALKHLLEKGVDVAQESLHFDPYRTFDMEFKRVLLGFFQEKIKSLEAKGCKKLIVLDDGGELLLFMNSLLKKSKFWRGKVVGIEQTTAGYDKLKSESLLLPVVNVARSNIKLFHESPFIARVAVERLLEHLNRLRIFPKNALIIGNGAVGSHIHSEIRELFRTETFDLDASKSSIKNDSYAAILGNFDLIIGCTGKTVIHPNQFRFLKKGACLVSVSSSDREFSGFNLRNKVKGISSCHQDVCVGDIHLLNCGFPINFDDAYEEIDIPEFQLTRAILLSGIYQSITKEHANGLIDLDSDLQEKIYHLYDQLFFPSEAVLREGSLTQT